MATASSTLTTFDNRPFFNKALRYGFEQGVISPERLNLIQEDFSKGIVQIAHFFGTAHLRPELDLALQRMVNLISLYLEDSSDGDLQIAAASLRDKTFLSHSKGGSDMLKRLHAMPDSTLMLGGPVSPESQRTYLDEKTAVDAISLAEYRSELALRQEYQNWISFSFWLAKKMGVARTEFDTRDDADQIIRSAMLVIFVDKADLRLPTRIAFVRLIKAAKQAKAKLNEDRLNVFLKDAPAEFQSLAKRAMQSFVKEALPELREWHNTADKLLDGDTDAHRYFVRVGLDEDNREYERQVAKEWDRVTAGEADDPAVVATVFFFVATDLPPKATMLLREAKEVIHIFRTSGFKSQAVIDFLTQHAPEAIREGLLREWEEDYKREAEEQLHDQDPDRPDTHMKRALEYLRKTCRVTWKNRGR
jgi:hypothetical protein